MGLLTQLQPDTNYLTLVLPAELLLGLGTSCVMVPAFSMGTLGVDRREAGIAAATVGTFQQIGGSATLSPPLGGWPSSCSVPSSPRS